MTTVTWTSDNGTTWPLDGSVGVTLVDGAAGLFTVPTSLIVDPRTGADGAVLAQSRRPARSVVLSLMVEQTGEVLTLWADLFRALAAGGTLRYDGQNGVRELRQCVLEAPGDGRFGYDLGSIDTEVVPVSLLALDPWWYGVEETLSGTFGSPTAWNAAVAWNASIPWDGGSSTTIINDGDAAAPVTIVVTGAATTASFSINGVGGWTTAASVASGEYLSVSSEPGRRGPHRGPHGYFAGSDGLTMWTLLTEASQLFDLPAGSSSLVFGVTGSDGSTAWDAFWSPRYLTP